MGQSTSAERARKKAVSLARSEATQRAWDLHPAAAAEEAEGTAAAPGSKQAVFEAAMWHSALLAAEYLAINDRIGGFC